MYKSIYQSYKKTLLEALKHKNPLKFANSGIRLADFCDGAKLNIGLNVRSGKILVKISKWKSGPPKIALFKSFN